MVEPINLRQFRKRKTREDKAMKASDNRLKHGLSKSEKNTNSRLFSLEQRRLDGKKLDDDA